MDGDEATIPTQAIADLIGTLDTVPLAGIVDELARLESGQTDPSVVTYLRERYQAPYAAPAVEPGDVVGGRYRIVRPLGRGGMGLVFVAEQAHVNRQVALKMLSPALASEGMIHRMAGEISSLGRLNHPHIVRIFDADVHHADGSGRSSLYFTMEIVDGMTIDRWVESDGGRGQDEVLACFAAVCDAVAFAHDRGIVHRDLKPGNVMVRADGMPAVLDFGIAGVRDTNLERAARESGAPAEAGGVSGTPEYMSPAKWNHADDLESGDVFALGVMLYELLAGRRPWRLPNAPSLRDIRTSIVDGSADRLRTVLPSVDPAVDELVHRLLGPEPEARPSSRELGDEVRRILRRRHRRAWLAKWSPAMAAGILVLATAAGLTGHRLWIHNRRLASEADFKDALVRMEQPGIDPATWIRGILPATPAVRHDNEAWRDLVIRAHARWVMAPHPGVAVPAGARLIATDDALVRHLARLEDGRLAFCGGDGILATPPGGSAVPDPAFAAVCPGRTLAAVLGRRGELFVWDGDAGQVISLGTFEGGGEALAFSPEGSHLACGETRSTEAGTIGRITVWRVGEWEAPMTLEKRFVAGDPLERQAECRSVDRLAWNRDGRAFATVGRDSRMVFVWGRGAESGTWSLEAANYHPSPVAALAWNGSRHASLLATGRRDGVVSLWERAARAGERLMVTTPTLEFGGPRSSSSASPSTGPAAEPVAGLAWLPGGAEVVAIGTDGTVNAWDLRQPSSPTRRFSLDSEVAASRWHAGGRILEVRGAPAPDAGAASRWWAWTPGRLAFGVYLPFETESLDFSADGTRLAAGGDKGLPLGAAVIDCSLGEVSAEWPRRLSGPVRFAPGTRRLWMFPRGRGLVSTDPAEWPGDPEGAARLIASPRHASTGALAFAGDGRSAVFSFGTEVSALAIPPAGTGAADSAPRPILELASADRVELSLNVDGSRLAVSWGQPRQSRLYRPDTSSAWSLEPGMPELEAAAVAFGTEPGRLFSYRPPVIECWDLDAATRVATGRAGIRPASPGSSSRLATGSDVVVVSSEGEGAVVLGHSAAGFAILGRLGSPPTARVSALAVTRDGSAAAVATDCWRGSLVTRWDLAEIGRLLEETGFAPTPAATEPSPLVRR